MLLGIQIIVFFFSLLMAYYSFLNFKRKELSKKETCLWLSLWTLVIITTCIPDLVKTFSNQIGLARPLDGYIIFGFMLLTSIIFYLYVLVRKNQRNTEEIVRKIAITPSCHSELVEESKTLDPSA